MSRVTRSWGGARTCQDSGSLEARVSAGGVLAVVANYTGDCLNFGLAVERARALGLAVEAVVVGEDCALLDRGGGAGGAGRRGLCGLLFVYKLAGALAEAGASLEAVAERARQVTARMATLGVCLSPCSLPGAGPLFTLGPDEMELGLGVHGEEGAFRLKLSSAHEVAEAMVARLAGALALAPGARVAALLNNLGGTSQLEQALMGGELRAALERRGVAVERLYAGHLMTSLEMAGVQLSVLRLPDEEAEAAAWLAALDEPTDAGAWPGCPLALPCALPPTPAPQELAHDE
ncbi:Bifunctional ATP-dependent dihydroxyacetone kinase/FAD-AMP lyase (Cyclizing), partial [Gryllus bimaculatus]